MLLMAHENPDAAPPVKPGQSAQPRPEYPALAPTVSEPVLLENEPVVLSAPSESMAGAVMIDGVRESVLLPESESVLEPPPVVAAAAVLLESEPAVVLAPSQSMAGVLTDEAPSVAAVPEAVAAAPASAPVPGQPVRVLPRRPRLRATFHYDADDAINIELTLMDDRRELIHRMALAVAPGGALARIFDALLGVVSQSATHAGVFGKTDR
jgi:hypothetical protein